MTTKTKTDYRTSLCEVRWMITLDVTKAMEIDRLSFPAEKQWTEKQFLTMVDSKTKINGMVAALGQQVIGFIAYKMNKTSFHILRLAVEPSNRSCGIGVKLLDTMYSKLREDGRNRITVNVSEENLALQLWLKENKYRAANIMKNYEQTLYRFLRKLATPSFQKVEKEEIQ